MKDAPAWAEQRASLPEELSRALRGAPEEPSQAALEDLASRLSHSLGLSVAAPQAAVATKAVVAVKPVFGLVGSTLLGVAMGVGLSAAVAVTSSAVKQPEAGRGSSATPTMTSPLPPTTVATRATEPVAEPRAAAPPGQEAVRVSSSRASASVPSTPLEAMQAELALLSRARAALTSDPIHSLTLCADHARMFAAGALGQEREVIAIDALLRAGRPAEARERARRFNDGFPGSAHARRITALLEASADR